jgi:pimeloyl-ACP methyl ester carboxylesterase
VTPHRHPARLLGTALAAAFALAACDPGRPSAGPTGSPSSTAPSATGTASESPKPSASAVPEIPGVASPQVVAAVKKYGSRKLSWRGCNDGFECAKMTVPLDYADPDGDTIQISVIRLKARKSNRIGSLVLNPGGPGGSGIEFARQVRQLLPGEILDRFDSVSFDPRGVGESAPVDCYGDAQLDTLLAIDPLPDSPAERNELLAANKDEAAACGRKSAKLLPHLGTVDAAKDMDVLRTALGDSKLTYVGFSYGTMLGARYAQQFPKNIRAFVLDGAVDPVLTTRETTIAQALGFERALDAFFDDCRKQSCAFAQHGDIGRTYDALMKKLDTHPLQASQDSRLVGPSEALFGVAAALYSREYGWPVLRQALESAYRGDGSTLLSLFDNLVERDQNGHFSNSLEAQAGISCVDGVYERDVAQYDKDSKEFAKQAPRFGGALAYGPVVCAYWPVPPVTRAGVVQAPGAPTMLVVGTTRDPATPYEWSRSLATQLPAVLLTHDGDGHTAYGYGRSACVDRVVDAYLLALTLPKAGTRCG